jgi:hypothetical protein
MMFLLVELSVSASGIPEGAGQIRRRVLDDKFPQPLPALDIRRTHQLKYPLMFRSAELVMINKIDCSRTSNSICRSL